MHKCKVFWPILLLTLAFGPKPLPAATIISVTGPSNNSLILFSSPDGAMHSLLVASWTSTNSYTNVDISATLGGVGVPPLIGGTPFNGTAYLMNQLGPGTTTGNQLATSSFFAPGMYGPVALFSGLNLGAGTYYLLLGSTIGQSGGWAIASTPTLSTDQGVSLNPFLFAEPPVAPYVPASTFLPISQGQIPLEFQVTGTAIPEPYTAGLAGIALLVMLSLKGRR